VKRDWLRCVSHVLNTNQFPTPQTLYDPKMALSAESRLALIRNKTEWAKKNLVNLETLANEHILDREYVVLDHPDPTKAGMQLIGKMPFDVILMAGDIIHNLSSALDHLAFNLVQVGGGTPTTQTCFPIAETRQKYESSKAAKVRGMTDFAKAAIDDLRPYGGGNESLWRIHHLDIVDKHRELIVIADQYLFTGEHFTGPYMVVGEEKHFSGIFASDSRQDLEAALNPTLIQTKISEMQPLIPSLHELTVFVDNLVGNFLPLLG
jgi:hypothetical protein